MDYHFECQPMKRADFRSKLKYGVFAATKGQKAYTEYAISLSQNNTTLLAKICDFLMEEYMDFKIFLSADGDNLDFIVRCQAVTDEAEANSQQTMQNLVSKFGLNSFSVYSGDWTTMDKDGEIVGWISIDE